MQLRPILKALELHKEDLEESLKIINSSEKALKSGSDQFKGI